MICAACAVGHATEREHDHIHRATSGAEKCIVRSADSVGISEQVRRVL
jgi:hypothetical protein